MKFENVKMTYLISDHWQAFHLETSDLLSSPYEIHKIKNHEKLKGNIILNFIKK